jgi:hypothetical protein
MKTYLSVLIVAFTIVPIFGAQSAHYPFQNPSLSPEQRIDNLLSLMTTDEKIAHHLSSKAERPPKQLVGFRRVTVEPCQTKTVQIAVPADRFAYWDVDKQSFAVEREAVSLMVGDSSASVPLSTTVHVQ